MSPVANFQDKSYQTRTQTFERCLHLHNKQAADKQAVGFGLVHARSQLVSESPSALTLAEVKFVQDDLLKPYIISRPPLR